VFPRRSEDESLRSEEFSRRLEERRHVPNKIFEKERKTLALVDPSSLRLGEFSLRRGVTIEG
jgi:hypothetical protein